MRSVDEIKEFLAKVDADERYHYPPADISINAPLAFIQTELATEARVLAWVLGVKPPQPKQRRKTVRKNSK
jgi:hypothetical protein